MKWSLALVLSLLFLSACQTPPIREFESVSLGQDKSDVIEKVGGPTWKDRRNGMDRWTYIIYQDGIKLERQIHFLDGIVTYKGEPIPPFITAEEKDQMNFEKNLALDEIDRNRAAMAKGVGSQSRRETHKKSNTRQLENANPQ